MKKIIFVFALLVSGSFFSSIIAQPSLDLGSVKFSIQPMNGSKAEFPPGDYVSSLENGGAPNVGENAEGEYAEVTFGGEFEKGGKPVGMTSYIRLDPPGTGTYILKKDDEKDNRFSIMIDNQILLTGINGQINITHYPKKAGELLTGTFDVVLMEGTDPDAPENLYKITGTFNIKRFEQE